MADPLAIEDPAVGLASTEGRRIAAQKSLELLTEREREVPAAVGRGQPNAGIAARRRASSVSLAQAIAATDSKRAEQLAIDAEQAAKSITNESEKAAALASLAQAIAATALLQETVTRPA